MAAREYGLKKVVSVIFRKLAQSYVRMRKPRVIAVAGSVGKTSSKLMLAKVLETERDVSYMDDSYNTGLGLYLSVFRLKVPARNNPFSWFWLFMRALWRFVTTHPEILVLEYGIDGIGDMDEMVGFIRPDIALLTAVAPEHMEFLKTIDIVGEEESKIITAAREYSLVCTPDVDKKYYADSHAVVLGYGGGGDRSQYTIRDWTSDGTVVDFSIDDELFIGIKLRLISEPAIRQLTGVLLLARELGISRHAIETVLPTIRSASSRMSLLEGVHGSMIIDDAANFSPNAGAIALQTLKRLPASRRIALLGNMHELGDYADEGYEAVAREFDGLDIIICVGDLASTRFRDLARKANFIDDTTLYTFPDAIEAADWLHHTLSKEDVLLVKGPFGGWYLEEATKRLLRHKRDVQYITRQSAFWDHKKRMHFGSRYDQS